MCSPSADFLTPSMGSRQRQRSPFLRRLGVREGECCVCLRPTFLPFIIIGIFTVGKESVLTYRVCGPFSSPPGPPRTSLSTTLDPHGTPSRIPGSPNPRTTLPHPPRVLGARGPPRTFGVPAPPPPRVPGPVALLLPVDSVPVPGLVSPHRPTHPPRPAHPIRDPGPETRDTCPLAPRTRLEIQGQSCAPVCPPPPRTPALPVHPAPCTQAPSLTPAPSPGPCRPAPTLTSAPNFRPHGPTPRRAPAPSPGPYIPAPRPAPAPSPGPRVYPPPRRPAPAPPADLRSDPAEPRVCRRRTGVRAGPKTGAPRGRGPGGAVRRQGRRVARPRQPRAAPRRQHA